MIITNMTKRVDLARVGIVSASHWFAHGSMKRSLTAHGGDMHIYKPSPVEAMHVSGAGEHLVTS